MSAPVIFDKGDVVLVDRYSPAILPRYYVATVVDVVTKSSYAETVAVAYLVRPASGIFRRLRWVNSMNIEGKIKES